jgi:hypothetical protein
MANLLKTYTDTIKTNNIKPMTFKSRQWFLDMLMAGALQGTWKDVRKDRSARVASAPMLGKMYTFSYIPKHKKTLPYYDRYPLILLADFPQAGSGFYGLNLHYLDPKRRALLLSRLYKMYSTGNDLTNEQLRIKMSYQLLKSAGKVKAFKPTFKRYLSEIPPEHWESAIFLPTQKFIGAPTATVWAESRKKIR